MTNTINNVPRGLLDRAWRALANSATGREIGAYLDADPCAPECAETCARASMCSTCSAAISAPSPAGVDGLETICVTQGGCNVSWTATKVLSPAGTALCRLSDAQAIIDGLRGEVADLRSMLATVSKAGLRGRTERDQQAQRIGELEGLLTAERNKVPLYEAVERACGDLPEGWKVELHMENGAAWIELYDAEGIEVENFPTNNERLDYTINDATDAALSAGKEGE